jgi:methionine-rich copper-binding protein CopC
MKIKRVGIKVSIAICGLVASFVFASMRPSIAWAHAFPEAEQPLVGSTVTAPPDRVTIKYDAPIQSLFATLKVLDRTGKSVAAGAPKVGPDHRTLSVKLKTLKPGNYTVKWSVVAEDGHRTEGSYGFTLAAHRS